MKSTNILVIEDYPPDVEIIRVYLEEASFKHKFFHTASFQEGINIIKENEIDIVLLDLSVKDSFGFNTVKNYVIEAPNTPMIVLTGMNNEVVGTQSVRAGAQDFLVKGDFTSKSLVKAIRYSLQRHKEKQQLKDENKELIRLKKKSDDISVLAKFGSYEMDIVNNSMSWNDEMFRIFGFQPQSFSPSLSDYINYVHSEDKEAIENFFESVTKDGDQHRIEHRIIVDGRIIKRLSVSARINFDDIQNRVLLIGSVQDITERSGKTTPIPTDEEAEEDFAITLKKTFTDISFNIRTPLFSIVNLVDMLENTLTNNHQKELMNSLKNSIDDLSSVLNKMANFSFLLTQKVELVEEPFNFKELVTNIEKSAKLKAQQYRKQIRFHVEKDIQERLIGDHRKITQLLDNLMETMLKFCDTNEQVELRVKHLKEDDQEDEVKVQLVGNYRGRRFSPPKNDVIIDLNRISQLTAEDKSGTLSFTILDKLTQALNREEFKVQNKAGNITQIKIQFPIRRNKQHTPADIQGEQPLGPTNILLVEDHAIHQIATTKLLENWSEHINVDIADNGKIGLELFNEKPYDLILMDLQMPQMDGIETTIRIRGMNTQIPIIALTANASTQEQENCFSVGIDEYLPKPFQPNELYAKILKVLNVYKN